MITTTTITTTKIPTSTTHRRHSSDKNKVVMVTLTKLVDDKKTTSQICSRQHVHHVYVNKPKKNYNKLTIVNNKNPSSLPLFSKNNKYMNSIAPTTPTTKKSSIPVKSSGTKKKLTTQQKQTSSLPPVKPTALRKSPITQLKEDLERLRKQVKSCILFPHFNY